MSEIDKFKLYEIKYETFKYYLAHGRHLCIIYLAFVGALLKFSLDKNTTPMLTYINRLAIILFCWWSERTRAVHLEAVYKLQDSMKTLTKELKIYEHRADCESFIKFVEQLKIINIIIGLSMMTLLVIKYLGYF